MSATDPLQQPYQLKHLRLKNRLMSTAHEPSYAEEGMPTRRYRLYHEEKARGGLALTMTAGSALVSPDSPAAFGNLHAYKDEIVPHLQSLVDACHAHGCAVMIQLTHLGRRTSWNTADWLPVLSASSVRESAHRSFPKSAEDWDIERIVSDYAAAAARMQAAGLDGIELEAYGHLLDAFWSPATNHREDDFGGSLDNRLRFCNRVIEAIRDAVGAEFIVGIRMVADEDWDRGLSREEGVEIAQRIAASGRFDFINLIRGHIDTDAALTRVIPLQGMRSAPHLDFAGEVRALTKFPVFHAARIADVATARHAIAEGKLDMVGMTRAHIADPHIMLKVERGEEDRIRPCVGATYCLDRIYEGNETLCIHNAATGREGWLPHRIERAETARRVVIIGAGPAGLEAARVAGERGHAVTLLEAQNEAGGQVRLIARQARRREMIGIVDWRLAELDRLGVDVRFNVYAEATDVENLNPEIVIVATGGLARLPDVDAEESLLTSSWDVIDGTSAVADEVLLYDDSGGHQGMSAAELIAESGAKLELVTPERFLSPDMGGMNVVPYIRALQQHGATVTVATRLVSVHRDGNALIAILGSDYADDWQAERRVDQVVVEHGTTPLDELYFALKPISRNLGAVDYRRLLAGQDPFVVQNPDADFTLYRIGDAVASRNIHAGIHDALRFGIW